jgi:hypothetical protein
VWQSVYLSVCPCPRCHPSHAHALAQLLLLLLSCLCPLHHTTPHCSGFGSLALHNLVLRDCPGSALRVERGDALLLADVTLVNNNWRSASDEGAISASQLGVVSCGGCATVTGSRLMALCDKSYTHICCYAELHLHITSPRPPQKILNCQTGGADSGDV